MRVKRKLKKIIKGRVWSGRAKRRFYSHDASLFEIKPKFIAVPKDTADLRALVNFVRQQKKDNPELSLTMRGAGTDMSGGAINDSIIVDLSKYFYHIGPMHNSQVSVEPGTFYRDLEHLTLAHGLLMPSFPASKELCTIGGMVANNSGGEKTLAYGKTSDYVTQLKIILTDGNEYVIKPLNQSQLSVKLRQHDFEGHIYREVYKLVRYNLALIQSSKPQVSKNSSGYNIWQVWDGKTFDLTKLIVGSQGTLGIITEATFKLVPVKPLSGMVVLLLPSFNRLGELIQSVLRTKPTSFESFDEHTIKFALRFFLTFYKTLGVWRFVWLGLSFLPFVSKLFRGLPKLILLVEYEGDSQAEIEAKIDRLKRLVKPYELELAVAHNKRQSSKFWTIRRESFNLLRKNVRGKHTAPFVDDVVVAPEHLPEFLPKLQQVLDKYNLLYTVAGHVGDGNFHIIPLMDLKKQSEREKIYPILEEVTDLVLKYKGCLTGEHNDGLIRGPLLEYAYGKDIHSIFKHIKNIFDPMNIFNPHKKVSADITYAKRHIRQRF